ncbi:MAG: YdbL family protein [candidate division Zixibacteria bacterium]|nr:YdbL family protein [candidate division Zixibacteria bacterium]
MYKKQIMVASVLLLLLTVSCTVKPPEITVTGEKTVLEKQLLGEYRFSSRSIFMPSVDGGIYLAAHEALLDSVPPTAEVQTSRRDYIIALANHKFNADDINRFKDAGAFGEDNQGFLFLLEDKLDNLDLADRNILPSILDEENNGRRVIMNRIIHLRADLTEDDLDDIKIIFAKRNIEDEKSGRMIQLESGEWIIKQ